MPGFADASVKAWIALKHFATETKIAVTWQSAATIECKAGDTIDLREHGWYSTQSLTVAMGNTGTLESSPSIVQSCIRSRPERRGAALTELELAPDTYVTRVVNELHENMSMLQQTLENLLIDESLGLSRRSVSTPRA